jgi:hypothetical protein
MMSEMMKRREQDYCPAFPITVIQLGLGNTDVALDWLERGGRAEPGFYMPSVDPVYDAVRSQPPIQGGDAAGTSSGLNATVNRESWRR